MFKGYMVPCLHILYRYWVVGFFVFTIFFFFFFFFFLIQINRSHDYMVRGSVLIDSQAYSLTGSVCKGYRAAWYSVYKLVICLHNVWII